MAGGLSDGLGVEPTWTVLLWEEGHALVEHERVDDRDGRLVPPGAHRPDPMGYTYVRVGATVLLIGVASGDGGVEDAALGGTSPTELILLSRGNLVALDLGEPPAAPRATSAGFDVLGWSVLPDDRSVLLTGDTSLALWREGAFAWRRHDVGLGGLRVTGRSGGHVVLRARVDHHGDGDLTVRIANGAVDVAAGGR